MGTYARATLIPIDGLATRGTATAASAKSKPHDLLELSVGYVMVLLAVWTPQPLQAVFYWSGLAWVALATAMSFDGWGVMGLRFSGFLRSLWVVGAALVLACVAVCVAGWLHTLHLPGGPILFVKRYSGYSIWAFLQEFLLMDFFLLRLLRLLPGKKKMAVMAAAGLFALAHLPNPILTPATMLWGIAGGLLFLRYRNLYTLAMAHAIFGICLATTIPTAINHNMRVGLGYIYYRPHVRLSSPEQHQRSQNDHIVSTHAWVIAEAATRRC